MDRHCDLVDSGRMPRLGFGTYGLPDDVCRRAVHYALDAGYRHVDTAAMYENEREVGQALARANVGREDVFLTTKIWFEDLSTDAVQRSTMDSLRRLDTDYVDLLLIHWPNPEVDLRATLDAMMVLRDRGFVRHVGVSNFNPSRLRRAIELAPVVCNQVEYHPFLAQDELLRIAGAHGLVLTAYCPLAQGRVAADETLRKIARCHGCSPAQVALRWLLQHERVVAIPRSSDPEHIADNLSAADLELDDAELRTIDGLARGERLVDPDWAPAWRH